MEKFKAAYRSSDGSVPVSEERLNEYKDKAPAALLDLWRTDGFGKYNDGLIEVIDPTHFEPSLWTWLGKEVPQYIPIAINGFGDLFYFKNLPQDEFNLRAGLKEEVCLIDIQHRRIEHLTWNLEEFFDEFLTSTEEREKWLWEDLFRQAIMEQGSLANNEVFTVTPILALGGALEIANLRKGNAQVYQDIAFQMTM